jgi:hypothetical protein
MKLTGDKTEAVYRRYAIVCEADLSEGLKKLAALEDSLRGKLQPCGTRTDFSHSLATISTEKPQITRERVAVEPVRSQPFSASNSQEQGKIQGIYGVSGRRAVVRSAGTAIPRQFIRAPCVAPFVENRELTENLSYIMVGGQHVSVSTSVWSLFRFWVTVSEIIAHKLM